jgi:hypothetical protein
MPDVRTSTVLERDANYAVVEQEAVAKFLMFSKPIHLVLEVHQAAGSLRFRDRCGNSFSTNSDYEYPRATNSAARIMILSTPPPTRVPRRLARAGERATSNDP